jgi:hypothetical protein
VSVSGVSAGIFSASFVALASADGTSPLSLTNDPLRAISATDPGDSLGNAKLSAAGKKPREKRTKARKTRTLNNPRLVIFSHCDPGPAVVPFYARPYLVVKHFFREMTSLRSTIGNGGTRTAVSQILGLTSRVGRFLSEHRMPEDFLYLSGGAQSRPSL